MMNTKASSVAGSGNRQQAVGSRKCATWKFSLASPSQDDHRYLSRERWKCVRCDEKGQLGATRGPSIPPEPNQKLIEEVLYHQQPIYKP